MSTEITWLGHSSYAVQTGKHALLIDPYLDDSPTSPVKAADVAADYILVTHGHFDHVTDVVSIATRTGATVIANFEICNWLQQQGIAEDKVQAMNLGGSVELPFGRVKMTMAQHSSALPDGSYGGMACGYVLTLDQKNVYFAGDTGLFFDMKLIGMEGIELAVLPIGDCFTMGPEDSIQAIKMLNPTRVLPCHYNTWAPIDQNAQAWADQVRSHTAADPVVLMPGEKVQL